MNKIKQIKCPTVVTEPKPNRKMAEIVENETPLTNSLNNDTQRNTLKQFSK